MFLVNTLDFKSSAGPFAGFWEGSIPLRSRHHHPSEGPYIRTRRKALAERLRITLDGAYPAAGENVAI